MLRRKIIAVVCVALGTAGCSTATAGHGSVAGSSGNSAVRAALTHVENSSWVDESDPTSGARFRLPTRTAVRTQAGPGGIAERLYASKAPHTQFVVSLGVVDFRDETQAVAGADAWADNLANSMRSAGAKDFTVSEKTQCTYRGLDCRSVRLGFTPLDHKSVSMVWLLRLIRSGRTIFVLQTIVDAPKAEVAADLPLIRSIQAKLASSLAVR